MATVKQVVMYSSRAFKLRRSGLPTVDVAAGRNVLDADVADHPYVKAHATGPMTADAAGAEALLEAQARIAELEGRLDTVSLLAEEHVRALGEAEARIADLTTALEAAGDGAALTAANARIVDLEQALEAKGADMQALIDSMTPPPGDGSTTPAPVPPAPVPPKPKK